MPDLGVPAGPEQEAKVPEAESFNEARLRLWDELVELHHCWAQYQYLFHSDERVRMLNACARSFFAVTQRVLIREVILGISRVTDPPTSGRFENLVIGTLLLDPQLERLPMMVRSELRAAIEKAQKAAEPIRAHRNKYIAHLDHATAMGAADAPLPKLPRTGITEALEALGIAYNIHNGALHGADASMELHPLGGADALVAILENSERWRLWQKIQPRTSNP